MIGGVGVDIVDVERLRVALGRTAGFAEMVFSDHERQSTESLPRPARRLAAMFAAKEAFLKAVGIGLWRGVPLRQIEVVRDGTGRDSRFRLGPLAEKALRDRGCTVAELSLSHQRNTAIAMVSVHGC